MSFKNSSSPGQLEWNDGLSVCIPEIDTENQNFIRLVSALNETIITRMSQQELQKRLQAIVDDAQTNFTYEEALLREWHYSEAEQHVQEHGQVLQALREIMRSFTHGGQENDWIKAALDAKQALIEHLLDEDVKYLNYRRSSDAGGHQYTIKHFKVEFARQKNESNYVRFLSPDTSRYRPT